MPTKEEMLSFAKSIEKIVKEIGWKEDEINRMVNDLKGEK